MTIAMPPRIRPPRQRPRCNGCSVARMKPRGRREAPPDDRLRAIRGRPHCGQSGTPAQPVTSSFSKARTAAPNDRPNNTPADPCDVRVSRLPFENFLMNDHQECPRLLSATPDARQNQSACFDSFLDRGDRGGDAAAVKYRPVSMPARDGVIPLLSGPAEQAGDPVEAGG